jgi:hypothetical protein
MITLAEPATRQSVLQRLARLTPNSERRWGRMTAHQMICHLNDSFGLALGEKTASMATGFFQQTVMKWGALYLPMTWPKDLPTRPEMAQDGTGTPPQQFEGDRAKLVRCIEQFCRLDGELATIQHPIFGLLTRVEWMRWGYLHADHHLRQFGE